MSYVSLNSYKDFSIQLIIYFLLYVAKCIVCGNLILCLTKYNHSNLVSKWIEYIKYVDNEIFAYKKPKDGEPAYDFYNAEDRSRHHEYLRNEFLQGSEINEDTTQFNYIKDILKYGSTNEVEFDIVVSNNIKKYNLVFFKIDRMYIYKYLNNAFNLLEKTGIDLFISVFLHKYHIYTLQFTQVLFNILYNVPESLILLLTLSNASFGFFAGIIVLVVLILSMCYSIGIILRYCNIIFNPVNKYFKNILSSIWNFFNEKLFKRFMNIGKNCDAEKENSEEDSSQTGGRGTHHSHGSHKSSSAALSALSTASDAAGAVSDAEKKSSSWGCYVLNMVKFFILFICVLVAVVLACILLCFVLMLALIVYFIIIFGLVISICFSYFIFGIMTLLILFNFYATNIKGYFVTNRHELKDKKGIPIQDEYQYEGTQEFNLLICFYLTFLNKTLIYYSLFVAFFVLPLITKTFGSVSLMISLIVAFAFGYQVYNIKKTLISKQITTISGQDNAATLSKQKSNALLASAVIQENSKKI